MAFYKTTLFDVLQINVGVKTKKKKQKLENDLSETITVFHIVKIYETRVI